MKKGIFKKRSWQPIQLALIIKIATEIRQRELFNLVFLICRNSEVFLLMTDTAEYFWPPISLTRKAVSLHQVDSLNTNPSECWQTSQTEEKAALGTLFG